MIFMNISFDSPLQYFDYFPIHNDLKIGCDDFIHVLQLVPGGYDMILTRLGMGNN